MLELLTASQMQTVDATAASLGYDTFALMKNAGQVVAEQVQARFPNSKNITVVAGSGNNGGDGYVAATHLKSAGYSVSLVCYGAGAPRSTDANKAAALWDGDVLRVHTEPASADALNLIEKADIVIDALLGAGLSRAPTGVMAELIKAINRNDGFTVSVDLPSGVDGNALNVFEPTVKADLTVTFFRYKTAHHVLPCKACCGELHLAQIGLNEDVLPDNAPHVQLNDPDLWRLKIRPPSLHDHKYTRGHVVVRGGGRTSSGAARLSAQTALNCGAGAVTLSCSKDAAEVVANHLTAVMIAVHDQPEQFSAMLEDKRINVAVLGPGNGVNTLTQACVLAALAGNVACVLDADALSVFADNREAFIQALRSTSNTAVLTPHDGEFNRLWPDDSHDDLAGISRIEKARYASDVSQSVVVYKGSDTIIASPAGQLCVNHNAPAHLATAGAGDVLAGLIAAMLAQGMPSFEAACAGVWLHADTAKQLHYPMTAEQLCAVAGESIARVLDTV